MNRIALRATASLTILAALLTGGCLASGESTVHVEGRSVGSAELECLKAGATTEQEMLAMLGTPSRTMVADEGGTIYVWTWRKEQREKGQAFLLVSGKSVTSSEQSAGVLVRSGVVQKWWLDSPPVS